MKLRIHGIDKLETDFFMAKNTEISSVANTINKLHIYYDLYLIYKQKFYHDKQEKMYEIFDEYHINLLKYIDHPTLIQEWKRNLDAAAYEKNANKYIKIPSKNKETDLHCSIDYWPTIIKEGIN